MLQRIRAKSLFEISLNHLHHYLNGIAQSASVFSQKNITPSFRALNYLTLATVIGVILGTALSITGDRDALPLPADVIASVNGRFIQRSVYDLALAERQRQLGASLSSTERHQVLRKLIHEELLFQAGTSNNAIKHDPEVLQAVIQAVTKVLTVETTAEPPTEATLKQFYEQHRNLFRRTEIPTSPPENAFPVAQVEAVYRAYLQDQAYSNYLNWLQTKATITVMPELSQ